eukprot:3601896-Pyramimonas_sp.AAC.1
MPAPRLQEGKSVGARTGINPFQSVFGRSQKSAAPETFSRAAGTQRLLLHPHPMLSSSWLRLSREL